MRDRQINRLIFFIVLVLLFSFLLSANAAETNTTTESNTTAAASKTTNAGNTGNAGNISNQIINATSLAEAESINFALNSAEKDMLSLIESGFKIIRYNDTLMLARQTFEAQIALQQTGGTADYSLIKQKIAELKEIKQNALVAMDELQALKNYLVQTERIDNKDIKENYDAAKKALESERYEECLLLIDQTYESERELETFEAKWGAFSDAISKTLVNRIKNNWLLITIVLIIIVGSWFAFHRKVEMWWIRNKIENMERRKVSIKGLIAKTQKNYFENGNLSELSYKTKIDKYAELIRDINRQIPLLKESLELKVKDEKRVNNNGKNNSKKTN